MAGALLALTACQPHVVIVTGTTLGMKATPGDGSSRPPQVTLGYKRAEAALVPTGSAGSTDDGRDAFSTMSAFDFRTRWFGETELSSFIGTGMAVRKIQGDDEHPGTQFQEAFAKATLTVVPEALQDRRKVLAAAARGLTDAERRAILVKIGHPAGAASPSAVLGEAILDAQNEDAVKRLEEAFAAVRH
jgi:hypothetical protein